MCECIVCTCPLGWCYVYVSVGVTPRITTPPPTRVGTASVTKHEVSPDRPCHDVYLPVRCCWSESLGPFGCGISLKWDTGSFLMLRVVGVGH